MTFDNGEMVEVTYPTKKDGKKGFTCVGEIRGPIKNTDMYEVKIPGGTIVYVESKWIERCLI